MSHHVSQAWAPGPDEPPLHPVDDGDIGWAVVQSVYEHQVDTSRGIFPVSQTMAMLPPTVLPPSPPPASYHTSYHNLVHEGAWGSPTPVGLGLMSPQAHFSATAPALHMPMPCYTSTPDAAAAFAMPPGQSPSPPWDADDMMSVSDPAGESPVYHPSPAELPLRSPRPNRMTLRTASHKPKRKPEGYKPPTSEKEDHVRRTHNEVEKKSRENLNVKFETLLDKIEELTHDKGVDIGLRLGGGAAGTRNEVNKAQVLEMAVALLARLQDHNEELEQRLGRMGAAEGMHTLAAMGNLGGRGEMEGDWMRS